MKKIILSILAFIFISAVSFGQIEIYEDGGTIDYSGGEYYMSAYASGQQYVDFIVTNNTGTAQDWRITRKRINEISTWSDYLCWGEFGVIGYCYGASQMDTNPWTTPLTDIVTILDGYDGLLKIYITPDIIPVDTDVTYRYYVGPDENTHMDSVDVKFQWYTGTEEEPEIAFNVSPNPSKDQITITSNQSNNSTVTMVDVLGNNVFTDKINGTKTINVSQFNSGIYFLRVESEGLKAKTKKIIIRH